MHLQNQPFDLRQATPRWRRDIHSMNMAEKRELLLAALKHVGGFAALSACIDCAVAHLVIYAAGITEVPEGIVASLQRVLASPKKAPR